MIDRFRTRRKIILLERCLYFNQKMRSVKTQDQIRDINIKKLNEHKKATSAQENYLNIKKPHKHVKGYTNKKAT